MSSNFDKLNPQQKSAVEALNGPVLVLAGAGSGKTRVLTHRIAHLLEQQVCHPWQILALTFTNKAAGEMKERVERLVPGVENELWIGTFHSVFARILRREIDQLGYDRHFAIYDSDDQLKVVKNLLKSLQIPKEELAPKLVRHRISQAKNAFQSPEQFGQLADGPRDDLIQKVYEGYENQLRRNNALDFDDLLVKPIELFDRFPERLEFYQERFRYILIDEYQDTNRVQYLMIKQLAARYRNICVVGDDDQSIYGWRGADIRNILDFQKDYPEGVTFKLEQNYRSTANILAVAQAVVENNRRRHPKQLWTENDSGSSVQLNQAFDEADEARQVAGELTAHHNRGYHWREMAVLYRTNAQARALEDQLRQKLIPYTIVGGTKFYERREIKDVLAYLQLLVNPRNDVALRRVINYPRRGIGASTLESLEQHAAAGEMSLLAAMRDPRLVDTLRPAVRSRFHEFVNLLDDLKLHLEQSTPGGTLTRLLDEIRLQDALLGEGPGGDDRWVNVQELKAAMDEFSENTGGDLEEFLEQTALVADVDNWEDDKERVVLMTVHSAKGLEFDLVMITGLEEGLFPIQRMDDPNAEEEERRLFYVAVTRARKELYLFHAGSRRVYSGRLPARPSSFLEEVPQELLERHQAGPSVASWQERIEAIQRRNLKQRSRKQTEPFPASPADNVSTGGDGFDQYANQELERLRVGMMVRHPKFGIGKVLKVTPTFQDARIKVEFEDRARLLQASMANLTLLDD